MKNIYVLLAHSGDYEDYHVNIVKAFELKEQAENEKIKLEIKEKDNKAMAEIEHDYWFEPTWYTIGEIELMKKPKYTR